MRLCGRATKNLKLSYQISATGILHVKGLQHVTEKL
jgi:hypothetical protein